MPAILRTRNAATAPIQPTEKVMCATRVNLLSWGVIVNLDLSAAISGLEKEVLSGLSAASLGWPGGGSRLFPHLIAPGSESAQCADMPVRDFVPKRWRLHQVLSHRTALTTVRVPCAMAQRSFER